MAQSATKQVGQGTEERNIPGREEEGQSGNWIKENEESEARYKAKRNNAKKIKRNRAM